MLRSSLGLILGGVSVTRTEFTGHLATSLVQCGLTKRCYSQWRECNDFCCSGYFGSHLVGASLIERQIQAMYGETLMVDILQSLAIVFLAIATSLRSK